MIRSCILIGAALVLGLCSASPSRAAGIKIDQISAVPYSEFVTLHASGHPSGAIEKYTPAPGQTLWLVTFRVTPEWDEATEQMDFDSETFGLYDGAQKVELLGGMMEFGVMERYFGPPYFYRSDDWKTEKPRSAWKRMWVSVPNGRTELVLRLTHVIYDRENRNEEPKKTPYTATVKLAGTPQPFDMNDFIEVRVRAVKMLESVEEKNEFDDKARARLIVNDGGSVMQLTVQFTPKRENALEESRFQWQPSWVGLSFGRGGRAVCTGTRQYGTLSADNTQSIERTDGEIWDSKTVSLYFPVPSNLKVFDVTFLGQKVTSGAVE